jgi:hypothetical protein
MNRPLGPDPVYTWPMGRIGATPGAGIGVLLVAACSPRDAYLEIRQTREALEPIQTPDQEVSLTSPTPSSASR